MMLLHVEVVITSSCGYNFSWGCNISWGYNHFCGHNLIGCFGSENLGGPKRAVAHIYIYVYTYVCTQMSVYIYAHI